MIKIMKLPLFLLVFVDVYIHFRIWIRIRNPRVRIQIRKKFQILGDPDPYPQHCSMVAAPAPCSTKMIRLLSGYATLAIRMSFYVLGEPELISTGIEPFYLPVQSVLRISAHFLKKKKH
jgi:hypothetical protein